MPPPPYKNSNKLEEQQQQSEVFATTRSVYGGGLHTLTSILLIEKDGEERGKGGESTQEFEKVWSNYGGEGHGQNQYTIRPCFAIKNTSTLSKS